MKNASRGNRAAVVSGVCLGLAAVLSAGGNIFDAVFNGPLFFSLTFIVSELMTVALPVLILMKRKDITIVAVSFVSMILKIGPVFNNFSRETVLNFAVDFSVFMLILYTCVPRMKSKFDIVEEYWFVPAVITAVVAGLGCIGLFEPVDFWDVLEMVQHIAMGVLNTAGVFALALWLKNSFEYSDEKSEC